MRVEKSIYAYSTEKSPYKKWGIKSALYSYRITNRKDSILYIQLFCELEFKFLLIPTVDNLIINSFLTRDDEIKLITA